VPAADVRRPLDWSERSLADLLAIDDYYTQFGLPIATNVVSAILTAARRIERFPYSGRRGKRGGTRHCIVAQYPYIIVYRVRARSVQVVRVLHQSRKFFS
jgi:addiction module RelE/StbE family toxin